MNSLVWAWKSLWFRRSLTVWSLVSIVVSSALLFSLLKLKDAAQTSFEGAVSGIDLIAGARTSELNLVLFSLFRLGQVTNNLSHESFEKIESMPEVDWAVPISTGDSLRGFPVIATNVEFLEKFKYGRNQPLVLANGRWFEHVHDAVLGAEVAEKLSLGIGSNIFISHGLEEEAIESHEEHSFEVVGVLRKTGTANDRSVFISLNAMAAVHHMEDHDSHKERHHAADTMEQQHSFKGPVTAIFLKLKNPQSLLNVRNEINQSTEEPMVAAIPSLVLRDFWNSLSFIGKAFELISGLVFLLSFICLASILLSTMEQRRREFIILRSIGFDRWKLLSIFVGEAKILCLAGSVLGWIVHFAFFFVAQEWIDEVWGLRIPVLGFAPGDLFIIFGIVAVGAFVSLLPFWAIYRRSLATELHAGI